MIKSALALALVMAVAMPAVPATAVAVQDGSVDRAWSPVQILEPGRTIILTIRGRQAADRAFISADAAGVTVLNVSDPVLPPQAVRTLLDTASQHPDYFARAATGAIFRLGDVRLHSGGVFVADRHVADLRRVVENYARAEVAEIAVRHKGRGMWGHLGALGGYFVGAMSGGILAGVACRAAAEGDGCDTGAFLTGALIGGIVGGVYGFRGANRETEEVIYRAP